MGGIRVALGFRAHSGWAVAIGVAGPAESPAVIHRQRIELVDRDIRGSVQPYHAAKEMPSDDAETFIRRGFEVARSMAETAVRQALTALSAYRMAGGCVLLASGRQLPGLQAILRSHPLIHTAEGVFFRQALKDACEVCGVPVSGVKERDLLSGAEAALGIPGGELQRRATGLGKNAGRPWGQDEKLATIAAWSLLANPL